MEKKSTKSVAALYEEARLTAASKLAAIVNAFAAEACGDKVSVPHAKFVLDIAQLSTPVAEKEPKATDDPGAEKVDPAATAEEPCLTEVLLRTLNELRITPVP